MTTKLITKPMQSALEEARRLGVVFAGATVQGGKVVRHNANTLMALSRRGWLVLEISPDGGMMGRIPNGAP